MHIMVQKSLHEDNHAAWAVSHMNVTALELSRGVSHIEVDSYDMQIMVQRSLYEDDHTSCSFGCTSHMNVTALELSRGSLSKIPRWLKVLSLRRAVTT